MRTCTGHSLEGSEGLLEDSARRAPRVFLDMVHTEVRFRVFLCTGVAFSRFEVGTALSKFVVLNAVLRSL